MDLYFLLTAILVFVFGTAIGSFLNVAVWRLPRKEQITHGRSHCPNCGHELRSKDLIPLVSYVLAKVNARIARNQFRHNISLLNL